MDNPEKLATRGTQNEKTIASNNNSWHSINWLSFRLLPAGETQHIVPPSSCRHGTIDWVYPSGTLELMFNQYAHFSLCLTDNPPTGGADSMTFFDNTFGSRTPLPNLTKGNIKHFYRGGGGEYFLLNIKYFKLRIKHTDDDQICNIYIIRFSHENYVRFVYASSCS